MVFKKIIFQNRYVELETPHPLHGKNHLKFPFWLFEYLPYFALRKLNSGSTWTSGWHPPHNFFLSWVLAATGTSEGILFLKNEWWFSRLWKTLRSLLGLQGGIGGPRKSVGTKSLRKHWALRIETDSKPRMWINNVAKEMDVIKVWTLDDLHFKSSFG